MHLSDVLVGFLALSERLRHLGFRFRSPPPTFVRIVPCPFYQLSHFLMLFIKNLTCKTRHLALCKVTLLVKLIEN